MTAVLQNTIMEITDRSRNSLIMPGAKASLLLRWSTVTDEQGHKHLRAAWTLLFIIMFATVSLFAQTATPPPPAPDAQTSMNDFTPPDSPSMLSHPDSRWWISGQMNFIAQWNPSFPGKYSGPNSFRNNYDKALSRVVTLFTGVRLNSSTELLFDVEEAGGTGLSDALGIAGFTNLDVVRNPTISKSPYIARGIFHKVFALSKDMVEADRTPLSLFTELPRRRLELRVGKFGTADFFDVNSAGTDSHFQFMNWTVDNNGAYDYPADTRGYTVGAVLDYEDRTWGVRAAELLMPTVANGIDLEWHLRKAHGESIEFDLRKNFLPGKPGVVRLLGYSNVANMGVYRVQNERYLEGLDAVPDITNHPLQQTRKYGFGFNFEQALASNVKVFGRFGWNNGKTESYAYTEVDQTIEAGIALYGPKWHRKYDRAGVAFVSNGIAADHQFYLQHGGVGFLLGDGGLTYGREDIFESYYNLHLWKGIFAGLNLQHINNPGYNRDRGPVVVPGFRMHVEL